jgi:vancomycin resistance protein YoaR
MVISDEEVTTSLSELIQSLEQNTTPAVLHLATSVQKELLSAQKRREMNQLYTSIKKLVKEPLVLQLAEKTVELDLNRDKDFMSIQDGVASLNETKLQEWVESFAEEHFRAPETVKIVGKEEVRAGVNRAVLEGQFVEGRRIKAEEIFSQIKEALEKDERTIVVKSYEIPVKVYSELEQQDYELLSVGYSEFSTGNAPNRVHNVKTGLDRVNGLLVDPGKNISFNKSVGNIDSEFRTGYGIFGSAALPVLGGGICQASTTFYRALLNLGVPITQRQNHSWDLSYYQAGGYGLDATIFPEVGLDVKAVNDLPSQLLFYSYIRPETEEAFVLIYGKGDGRKVTLTPEKEYVPFKGPKTLKWKQTIELPNGEIREEEIVSRYRA